MSEAALHEVPRQLRVLVCGGRSFTNRRLIYETLNALRDHNRDVFLIHGAARGADTLAAQWAHAHDVPEAAFPANWPAYGAAAGPVRNAEMLSRGRPDLVVAFPGGRGTANMVRQATEAGVRVVRIEE